ncbi:PspC domain-containing protein [Sphingomonas lutea]|uniref:PspC domain-containing protein n=1 Tax=Sphingomonas lutea TaxID=1045317 RepID=A0A7G9SFD3_9SPHN|nr:PspC domain-containing protein [Sphingomonas lutea]QNN66558.1 PspC domain-containing protein [Sphingomonas lutea]
MQAHDDQTALPFRAHTILGVFEAIGEDFGFNPNWLRIPFAASVLFSPMIAIAVYFGLGVAVLASRLLFPKAKSGVVSADAQATSQIVPANDPAKQDDLSIAA